jgi:signal transduction histidine kinase
MSSHDDPLAWWKQPHLATELHDTTLQHLQAALLHIAIARDASSSRIRENAVSICEQEIRQGAESLRALIQHVRRTEDPASLPVDGSPGASPDPTD